jgi:peptide/nickel transport system permease protein
VTAGKRMGENGVPDSKRRSFWLDAGRRLVKEKPLGTFGAVITVLLLLTGIFANYLAPYGMNDVDAGPSLSAPSVEFLLGTDNLGRDILSRIIYGARISVIVGLSASGMSTLLALIFGVLSGYFGGTFDLLVQRFVDGWLCLPPLIVLMLIVSVTGPGMWPIIIIMGIGGGIGTTRLIRSAVISIKENVYLTAAVAIGSPTYRILFRHVLPNLMATVIVLFSVQVPAMIMGEASLSFLGFGIPAPQPSWGGMLSGSARRYMFLAPWMAIWPGLALSIVVYGVNMFGDALRDILDPRLRGGSGRYGVIAKKLVARRRSVDSSPR